MSEPAPGEMHVRIGLDDGSPIIEGTLVSILTVDNRRLELTVRVADGRERVVRIVMRPRGWRDTAEWSAGGPGGGE